MSFPLYFDEDQDERVASRLIREGFDVLTTLAADRANQRRADEDQLSFAAARGRAIVTRNATDYEALYRRWWADGRHHAGIVIATPRRQPFEIYEGLVQMQKLHSPGIADLILYV